MKSIKAIFFAFALINIILANSNNLKKEQVGISSNVRNENVMAISYGIAATKTDQYFVNNQKGYVTPTYVNTLPPRKPISGGQIETVEELPTENSYYDGTKKLRITTVSCNQWTTVPELCVKQSSCGWCGSSANCIQGNNLGPLAPCMKGQFFFSAPSRDWNPLGHNNFNVSRKEILGAQLTTITDRTK